MALIPPFMIDTVVAIGFLDPASSTVGYAGTGFLYGRRTGTNATTNTGTYQIFLVTNRHVLAGHQTMHVRFNPIAAAPAQVLDAPLVDQAGQSIWHGHPDSEVDLAVVSINFQGLDQRGIRYSVILQDQHTLRLSDAQQMGLSEGDGVFVLGFPMGNVGAERNYVVVRQGCIARIRDSIAGTEKQFLVDAAVFPGNSGGPVILRPEITAIDGTKSITAARLVGVVSGYLPYRDVAISQQTRNARIIFEENSGLAAVVPVDRIDEVVEHAMTALSTPNLNP